MAEKSTAPVPVYIFRDPHFSSAGDTVASAAPLEAVVAAYGGGGIKQTGGLSKAFGGAAVYRKGLPILGTHYLGVWGERKASKFRETLRQAGITIEIIKSPPPGRLVFWSTNSSSGERTRIIPDDSNEVKD